MALSRYKGLLRNPAIKKFTDRETAQSAFDRLLTDVLGDRRKIIALVFYGAGGMGKTALINEIRSKYKGDAPVFKAAYVDLENPILSSSLEIMLDIRRQIGVPCFRFEYALARAMQAYGEELKHLNRALLGSNSVLLEIVDAASGTVGALPIFKLFAKVVEKASSFVKRRWSEVADDVRAIDVLSEEELIARIPCFLAEDLNAGLAAKGSKAVIFLDTFDALHKKSGYYNSKERSDAWIRELIGASEQTLFVIGSREYIRWDEANPEWRDVLEQHLIGALSPRDADRYLMSVPITEDAIRSAIVEASAGVPLYLDLCASTYLIEKQKGQVTGLAPFTGHERDVIERFLSHLDAGVRDAVQAVALVGTFDAGLFKAIVTALNLPVPFSFFEDFCSISYSEVVDKTLAIHRVQETFAKHLARSPSPALVAGVAEALACEMRREASAPDRAHPRAMWLIEQYLALVRRNRLRPEDRHEGEWSVVLDETLRLIDAGRWVWASKALGDTGDGDPRSASRFEARAALLRAYCRRKEGRLAEAAELYDAISIRADVLGTWFGLARFLRAHTGQLIGEFDAAAMIYQEILSANGRSPGDGLTHDLAERQLGDILMMRGEFARAGGIFERSFGGHSSDAIWQAECLRFQGHVAHFNFHCDDAVARYAEALEYSQGARCEAMVGKALTNQAEAYCWLDAPRAIEVAGEAIESNLQVHSPIEVGKAYAARGIARCMAGDFAAARSDAERAIAIHEASHYRAGRLFGLQARALAEFGEDRPVELERTLAELESESARMNVYPYLVATTQYWCGRIDEARLQASASWLDFARTLRELAAAKQRFG